ncbi:DUF3800 domain-containing protein [Rhodospirillaceae bacterium KN72]|uniref:DUF3800 domain-containing protein n=1 Tax=Pacificispira spongiicola TaxID=2729598 RepID=A0A7Y0HG53_9PROT|nr:DUF3800 domain-containing protein [Pacificispira spongiicola]NMM44557.1 DUF3800 domain-containing protein [Pacificispira spongiicola]
MYVLYLDDAGSVKNSSDKYFVLGGIAIFERQIHYLSEEMEKVAVRTGHPNPQNIELHGNEIFSGRGWWRSIANKKRRRQFIHDALYSVNLLRGDWALFGVAVNKQDVSPKDPIEVAFEQICSRFDLYLGRMYKNYNNPQRGMIVFDKSTRETRLQTLATEFRRSGHSWGKLHNLADVPLFVDSRATRSVQYADLVAYSIRRYFEAHDTSFLDPIKRHFDNEGGTLHGLVHVRKNEGVCPCLACNPSFLGK